VSLPGYAQTGDVLIANVYQDDNVSIRAGIADLENHILHFGDVLSLIVEISYDPSEVQIQDIDGTFFSGAWTEAEGAFLLSHETFPEPESDGGINLSTHVFRFQILACPDGEVLCKGSRFYDIPEFSLEYHILDENSAEASVQTAQFRPWQTTLMIASAIPLGEEGELNSFGTYFPAGAYPKPLMGIIDRYSSSGFLAGGLILLMGGLLMSPFSIFKRKGFAARTKARWEDVLEKLKAGEVQNESEFLDILRKCLVWYCIDELDVDPFYWLKHEEEVMHDVQKGTGELAGYRELFLDLLHSPTGQNDELLDRFTRLISNAA
jgi:hypothetical protein